MDSGNYRRAGKGAAFLTVATLSLYLIQGTVSAVNPVIANMAEHFSDYPLSTVMLISSIISLTSIIGNLVFGPYIKKVGFKNGLLIAFIVYFVGGLLPYFTFDSLPAVLTSRAILGVGYGILHPACTTMILQYLPQEKQNTLLGIGSTISTLAGVLFTMVSGFLFGISLRAVFFTHLISLIPFVLIILLPNSLLTTSASGSAEESQQSENDAAEKVRFGGESVFWQVFIGVVILFFYVLYLFSSLLIADYGGTPMQASLVASISMVAGCISGLIFGKMFQVLKRWFVPFAAAIAASGFILMFFGKSVPLFYCGSALIGFGVMLILPYAFAMIGMTTPPSKVASANGNAALSMNLGTFGCSYVFSLLAGLFGASGNQIVFLISGIFFAVTAVLFALKKG